MLDNPYLPDLLKGWRHKYLEYLDAGGEEVVLRRPEPHVSSQIKSVHDSQLGYCPKRAALERNEITPTHPSLALRSLNDLHKMRSGVLAERDWIETLMFASVFTKWQVFNQLPVNDLSGHTRGKVDVFLSLSDPIFIDNREYTGIIVELKRTNGPLSQTYVYQICSYLWKLDNPSYIGKIILDHRNMIEEFTVVPKTDPTDPYVVVKWDIYNREGEIEAGQTVSDLLDEIDKHVQWMDNIASSPISKYTLPDGITSPLSHWQCHQNWRKREGKARFRCPYAGYCFNIQAEEFDVFNEKEGRRIVARIVIADDGTKYRSEELGNGNE